MPRMEAFCLCGNNLIYIGAALCKIEIIWARRLPGIWEILSSFSVIYIGMHFSDKKT